jgi:hypothetical protein
MNESKKTARNPKTDQNRAKSPKTSKMPLFAKNIRKFTMKKVKNHDFAKICEK